MNELATYSFNADLMEVHENGANYQISANGGKNYGLIRNVDFGLIPKLNKPTLFKSGAEKVAMALGLCQNYELVSKIEDLENGFFFYTIRCDLVKIVNGEKYVITSSYGSANTKERRCGSQSPFDGANSCVKMAQKRALVGACIAVGGLSDMFTQDIENESDLSDDSSVYAKTDPNNTITAKQVTFFYAVCSRNGLTKEEAKELLAKHGYKSSKEILGKDFDAILEEVRGGKQ